MDEMLHHCKAVARGSKRYVYIRGRGKRTPEKKEYKRKKKKKKKIKR